MTAVEQVAAMLAAHTLTAWKPSPSAYLRVGKVVWRHLCWELPATVRTLGGLGISHYNNETSSYEVRLSDYTGWRTAGRHGDYDWGGVLLGTYVPEPGRINKRRKKQLEQMEECP